VSSTINVFNKNTLLFVGGRRNANPLHSFDCMVLIANSVLGDK
jgi:hypothetical protein